MTEPQSAELQGKVALVSGAARGQGRAIARRFVAAGARVIAGDLRSEQLSSLADELGDSILTVELDVRNVEDWERALSRSVQAFSALDILVNNAGVLRASLIENESPEAFEDTFRVNCLGAFLGIQAAIPHLRRVGGGAIVNTLSTVAFTAWTHHGAYGASKWALRGLTKVAALELAPDGIRVNAVVPGPIETPMVLPVEDPAMRALLSATPLGRIGQPEDVAEAVLYLASDRSSFVTGAELTVDGGQIVGPRSMRSL